MEKSGFYAIFITALLIINILPFISQEGESELFTLSTITWTSIKYVDASETFEYDDLTIVASGIQVNGSGTLNFTGCTIYNAGNYIINGKAFMRNTTITMNSTTNGQYRIEVGGTGNFTAINCTFTASDKTSVNTDPTAWLTSYGSKYPFTALRDSKMTLIDCDITHVWGNSNINLLQGGGVRVYSSDVLIDNCSIGDSEIAGVFVFGSVSPVIRNNDVYNNTFTQMLQISFATPVVDNNTFRNSPSSGGWGVYLFMDCEPEFTNNTIEYITWSGLVIQQHSNATVRGNTIRNVTDDGILVWGHPGNNGPTIDGNHIYNNSIGINLQPNDDTGTSTGDIQGNISNNLVEYNNNSGILVNNYAGTAGLGTTITSVLYNNTVTKNEAGVVIWESDPSVYYNTISENIFTGLYVLENSDPDVMYNNVSDNLQHGIFINTSSEPMVVDNVVQGNMFFGVFTMDAAPTISMNNVSYNNASGILVDGQSKLFNIATNNITGNSADGISVNNSSPSIISTNIIQANNASGIGVYNNSNPNINTNIITNNIDNGILFLGTSGTLGGNNNISWNRQNGVACYNNADPIIGFSTLYQNFEAGVLSHNSQPRILNSVLDGNLMYGINSSTTSGDRLENSTIINSGMFDYYLSANTHPVSINSVYNKVSVSFADPVSTLRGQWFFNINVTDAVSNPLNGASLNLTLSSASGPLAWTGSTNAIGQAKFINITRYIQTQAGDTNVGPHYVNADAFNFVPATSGPYSGENNFWVDFALAANQAPAAGKFLLPAETHDETPTLSWSPGVDPEAQPLIYNVKIGTSPDTSNVYFVTDLATNSLTLPINTLNHDYISTNRTYYVTIDFDDKDGGTNVTSGEFFLINNRPSQPYINLTPNDPTIHDTITCTIDVQSLDIDTDPVDNVTYSYKWSVNDILKLTLSKNDTKDTSMSIKSGDGGVDFNKHDTIKCTVTAYDGYLIGIQDIKSVKIKNLKPTVKKTFMDKTISEDGFLFNVFDLYDYFDDPDDYMGDPLTSTLDFRSVSSLNVTVNIDPDGTVDVIPMANWHGTEIIKFIAEDSDHELISSEFELTVDPVNDQPTILSIAGRMVITDTIMPFVFAESSNKVTLEVVVSDADIERGEGDGLYYYLDKTGAGKVSIIPDPTDQLKANIEFIPDDDNLGTWSFDVMVRDYDDMTWDSIATVKFTINNINDAPVFREVIQEELEYNVTLDPGDKNKYVEFRNELSAVEGQWFNLTIIYSDQDASEIFKFEIDDKVRFKIDTNTGSDFSLELQFLPTKNDVGTVKVALSIFDRAFAEDKLEIAINVKNINDAPTALILRPNDKDQFFYTTEIHFQGDFVDPDLSFSDTHTFEWESDLVGTIGDERDLRTTGLPTGWHKITFTVTDSGGLNDSVTITIHIITPDDQDGDGLPDDWEIQYFDEPGSYGPDDDPDDDGFTNVQEYDAGTNPMDAGSYPKEKGSEVDETVVLVVIILAIIIIIIAVSLFGYLLKTQRKKEVVGWDWMTPQDQQIGQLETLPGYEAAPQVPPPAGGVPIGGPGQARAPVMPPVAGGPPGGPQAAGMPPAAGGPQPQIPAPSPTPQPALPPTQMEDGGEKQVARGPPHTD